MGDGRYAVVNEAGTVQGLLRVQIAGASIFPDVPRATTAFPAVLVAEHMANITFGPASTRPQAVVMDCQLGDNTRPDHGATRGA